MFTDGILEREVPGIAEWIEAQEENMGDLHDYGVDFAGMDDATLINHLQEREPNAFGDQVPNNFNEIACEPPDCPLMPALVTELDATLLQEFNMRATNMELKKLKWDRALQICSQY
jgi:hypothetical protein